MATVAELTAILRANATQFNATMAQAGASVQSVSTTSKVASKAMSTGWMVAGAAVAFAVTKTISSFLEFEETMLKVVNLASVSEDALEGMADAVLELAVATGRDPQELAEALFQVASSGIAANKALGVVESAAKGAAIGLGDTATVADAVTSVLNAYGPEAISAARATDLLAAAVKEGKGESDAIAGAIGRVIPVASEMGIGFDQVAAAIASTTQTGLDANEAVTALRGVMTSLLDPTQRAEQALSRYGFSVEEIQSMIAERGLLATLFTLQEAFGDNNRAMSELFPNVRALVGALSLTGANAADVEQVFRRVADSTGLVDEGFNRLQETAGFKVKQAFAAIKVAMIEVGGALAPLVEVFADLVKMAAPLVGLVTKLGAAFLAYGALRFLPPLLGAIAGGLGLVTKAAFAAGAVKLGTAMGGAALAASGLATSVGALAAPVAAAVGAFAIATKVANDHSTSMQDVREEYDRGKISLDEYATRLGTAGHGAVFFAGGMDALAPSVAEVEQRVAMADSMLQKNVETLVAATTAAAGLNVPLRDLAAVTGEAANSLRDELNAALAEGGEAAAKWATDQLKAIDEWHAGLTEAFDFAGAALESLASKNKVTADQIENSLDKQITAARDYARNWEEVSRRGGKSADSMLAFIASMGIEGTAILQGLAGANDKQMERIFTKWNRAQGESKKLVSDVEHELVGGLRRLTNVLTQLAEGLGIDIASGIANGIDAQAPSIVQSAEQAVLRAMAAARAAAGAKSPSKVMFALGQDLIEGLIRGVDSRDRQVVNALGNFRAGGTAVQSAAVTAAPTVITAAPGMVTGGGGGDVIVNIANLIAGSPEEAASALRDELLKLKRSRGGSLGLA